ncbi:hypothetical protein H3T50_02090 [Commensalibacter sp. M0134]|uniref:hypothetical protein n=1 Tax=Commensalibacter TaxID=1079922 RepID=UPI0018DD959F|nr:MULTISPECIES: hypothetical protein [Commensalibacter]MBI0065456.1 hypothetical protein [Commensalibacter sp. M0134]MBI0069339.1 hypothetical protein [Commensalibacter sp. M0133]MBI0081058.1 hypothetical protein [Commensalibacter melissae]
MSPNIGEALVRDGVNGCIGAIEIVTVPMMPVIALAPPMIPVWIMPLGILSMSVVLSYPKERRMLYKLIGEYQ